jgi:hypothetical protein
MAFMQLKNLLCTASRACTLADKSATVAEAGGSCAHRNPANQSSVVICRLSSAMITIKTDAEDIELFI